ncbi:MAG: hypothetical protein E7266_05040 [Lachnospiraceae bacterium]|nr:hypothetical protein [Lachnospiraceae bacterium]
MRNKKKIVVYIMIISILLIFTGTLYVQINSSLQVKSVNVDIREYGIGWTFEEFKSLYEYVNETEDKDYQLIRQENVFPSEDKNDYCGITIWAKIKNRSFLDVNVYNTYIVDEDVNSPIIKASTEISEDFGNFEEVEEFCVIAFDMYRGDMTDEEILEYIKTLKLEVYYGNTIDRNSTLKLDLKDYDVKLSDR